MLRRAMLGSLSPMALTTNKRKQNEASGRIGMKSTYSTSSNTQIDQCNLIRKERLFQACSGQILGLDSNGDRSDRKHSKSNGSYKASYLEQQIDDELADGRRQCGNLRVWLTNVEFGRIVIAVSRVEARGLYLSCWGRWYCTHR
jgi:hypothetical protein